MLKKINLIILLLVFVILSVQANSGSKVLSQRNKRIASKSELISFINKCNDSSFIEIEKIDQLVWPDKFTNDNFYTTLIMNYKLNVNYDMYNNFKQELMSILDNLAIAKCKGKIDDKYKNDYTVKFAGDVKSSDIYYVVPEDIYSILKNNSLWSSVTAEFKFHLKNFEPIKKHVNLYINLQHAEWKNMEFNNSINVSLQGLQSLELSITEDLLSAMSGQQFEINTFMGIKSEYFTYYKEERGHREDWIQKAKDLKYITDIEAEFLKNIRLNNLKKEEKKKLVLFEEKLLVSNCKTTGVITEDEVNNILKERNYISNIVLGLPKILNDYSKLYSIKQVGEFKLASDSANNINSDNIGVNINFDILFNKNEYARLKYKLLILLKPVIVKRKVCSSKEEVLSFIGDECAIVFVNLHSQQKQYEAYILPKQFYIKEIKKYLETKLFCDFTFNTTNENEQIKKYNILEARFFDRIDMNRIGSNRLPYNDDKLLFFYDDIVYKRLKDGNFVEYYIGKTDKYYGFDHLLRKAMNSKPKKKTLYSYISYDFERFDFTEEQLKIIKENPEIKIITGEESNFLCKMLAWTSFEPLNYEQFSPIMLTAYGLDKDEIISAAYGVYKVDRENFAIGIQAALLGYLPAQKEYFNHGGIGVFIKRARFNHDNCDWEIDFSSNPSLKKGMLIKNKNLVKQLKHAKVGDVITLELAHGAKVDCVVQEYKEEVEAANDEFDIAKAEQEIAEFFGEQKVDKVTKKNNKTKTKPQNKKTPPKKTMPKAEKIDPVKEEEPKIEEAIPVDYDLSTLHKILQLMQSCKKDGKIELSEDTFNQITQLHNFKADFAIAKKLNLFLYCFMENDYRFRSYATQIPKHLKKEINSELLKVVCNNCKKLSKPKKKCQACTVFRKDAAEKLAIEKYNDLVQELQQLIAEKLKK